LAKYNGLRSSYAERASIINKNIGKLEAVVVASALDDM